MGRRPWHGRRQVRPDILVVNVSMPGMTGTQATQALKASSPRSRCSPSRSTRTGGTLRSLLEAGASGYILKRAAANELVQAIHTVASGGTYLDPTLAGKLVDRYVRTGRRDPPVGLEDALSEREEQVLRLIAQGFSNKEITARLDVGIKSVESYKARPGAEDSASPAAPTSSGTRCRRDGSRIAEGQHGARLSRRGHHPRLPGKSWHGAEGWSRQTRPGSRRISRIPDPAQARPEVRSGRERQQPRAIACQLKDGANGQEARRCRSLPHLLPGGSSRQKAVHG